MHTKTSSTTSSSVKITSIKEIDSIKVTEQTFKTVKTGEELSSYLVKFCCMIDKLNEEIEELLETNDNSTKYNQKYMNEAERVDKMIKLVELKSLRNKDINELTKYLVDY